jgi:restriction endonuclease S subunit
MSQQVIEVGYEVIQKKGGGRSSEEWRRVTLAEISQIICGATPSTSIPEYWADEIKWVTAKDVSESTGYKIYDTERKISRLGFENCSTRMIPKESTVLIARGATMGRSCLLGEDMAINQTCYALVPDREKVDPYFLFYGMVQPVVKTAEIFENGSSCNKMNSSTKTECNEVQCPTEKFLLKQKSK